MTSNFLRSVSSISIKSLFGMYDYELDISADGSTEDEKISIFYGDNGSGKSTLLRLVFHMLAPNRGRGHKTYLLKTDFQELVVIFNDGTTVQAKRKKGKISGEYRLNVKRPNKKSVSADVVPDGDSEKESPLHSLVEPALEELDCAFYLLSDDREFHHAGAGSEKSRSRYRKIVRFDERLNRERELRSFRSEHPETPEDIAKKLLRSAIDRTEVWFRSGVLRSSTRGDSGVNEVYTKILKRISTAGGSKTIENSTKKQVEGRVNKLVNESKNFSKYGLLPKFDGKDILQILNSANTKTFAVIIEVLVPYLDSMETKNAAMQDIYERIDTFVTVADKFYTNKKLSFDLRKGITIVSSNNRLLDPGMLSSGERHLLLLFCTSIVTGDNPSILMIDEPEISLNIKWQRMLIDALIQCIGDNDIQFIFSTHSLEILAKHKSRVVKLENQHG